MFNNLNHKWFWILLPVILGIIVTPLKPAQAGCANSGQGYVACASIDLQTDGSGNVTLGAISVSIGRNSALSGAFTDPTTGRASAFAVGSAGDASVQLDSPYTSPSDTPNIQSFTGLTTSNFSQISLIP